MKNHQVLIVSKNRTTNTNYTKYQCTQDKLDEVFTSNLLTGNLPMLRDILSLLRDSLPLLRDNFLSSVNNIPKLKNTLLELSELHNYNELSTT